MKRALLLLALVIVVGWLVSATPRGVKGETRSSWFSSRASATSSSSVVAAPSSASKVPDPPCGGCDPNEESACINNGGSWDSNTCTCTYGCDPNAEAQCYFDGGSWDPNSCTCTQPECNPGPPQVVGFEQTQYSYCDGWEVWDCSGSWTDYETFCQDGSVYDSWTEYTEACNSSGWYCGEGCDFDPYSCCDDWYCF